MSNYEPPQRVRGVVSVIVEKVQQSRPRALGAFRTATREQKMRSIVFYLAWSVTSMYYRRSDIVPIPPPETTPAYQNPLHQDQSLVLPVDRRSSASDAAHTEESPKIPQIPQILGQD